MRFRLKENVYIQMASADWLTAGAEYEGIWTPGWPKDPREVRLFRPMDPTRWIDISCEALEQVL
jgi:hypothetical protein